MSILLSWTRMKTSRFQLSLLLSVLVHVLLLGLLRFSSLSGPRPPATSPSDAPVAVRLLDLPPQTPAPLAQVPERARKLPEAPVRKTAPEAPKPPAPPRAAEPTPPKPAAPPPPNRGGTVVDLPKPVHEERPEDARLISRYDSKAQDIGPGEGGSRKPSGERPRAMPPEIPLPERYSTGQRTPPEAPLEASTPPAPTPPQVTPAPPKPPAPPAAKAEPAAPKPPAPVLKSEVLPPPKPPTPAPQAKPAAPARPAPPATPRMLAEEKQRPAAPPSPPAPQAKAVPSAPEAPRTVPEAPRVPATEQRQAEASPNGSMPQPAPAPAPPAVPKMPLANERQKLTAAQELAMVQRDPQERAQGGKPAGGEQQGLNEHFARLEKHLPLPSFDAPGVFERGPEQAGEGRGNGEGGKYRSIASFGFKHVSYLLAMQRKIELVFTVPHFAPNR